MTDTLSVDAAPYWTVRCTPGSAICDEDLAFVVIVTGSYDVVIQYDDSITGGDGDVARVRVKDSSSASTNVFAQLISSDGLPVLQLSATKSKLDVVLLRKERGRSVVNQGSGVVTIHEDVLVTSGPTLAVSAVGSGDIYLKTSTPLTVEELTLSTQGSGRIQASFSEFDVTSLSVEVSSSGGATVLSESTGNANSLALSVQGSGSLCVTADSVDTDHLKIEKVGTGIVSLGPSGSCQDAELTSTGSGTIDMGGIKCHDVNVDLLGSGNVVVQATGSLSGDVYGSGHLKYYGSTPHSIENSNYMGLVTTTPTSSSYQPLGCKAKPFPSFAPAHPTDSADSAAGNSVGVEFSYNVDVDQSNIIYLVAVVLFVALVLRWFNESRRRAREEQRQPLVGAERQVYV